MIKKINGDLLNCPSNILVHQANCYCTFGSGIAYQIRQKYPEAFDADLETKSGDISKLGTYSYAKTKDNKIIFNLYSQFGFGNEQRQTNYEAFYVGLLKIRQKIVELQQKSQNKYIVGLPYKIGCGLGGGSWKIVRTIIDEIFEDAKIECLIVKYQENAKL